MPTELVPVKWGEQHFLIASDKLMNFAYAVHSGAESQIVEYLAKSEDYQKPRRGLPNLPKEYERILKMKAVKARITTVNQGKEGEVFGAEIMLNVGSKDNVGKGMIFYFTNSKNQLSVVITDLREKTSIARINGIATMEGGEEDFAPKIGMKFTSKIPNDFFEP